MKRLFMAGIAAAAVIAGTSAMAQDEAPPGPPPGTMEKTTTTTTTWTVRPEERTVIHDYIGRARPEAVKEEVTIGAAIPTDVEIQPVPAEVYAKVPESQRYEYFDWNGRMVFVDPDSRKVVQIVD